MEEATQGPAATINSDQASYKVRVVHARMRSFLAEIVTRKYITIHFNITQGMSEMETRKVPPTAGLFPSPPHITPKTG